ncbi:MAG: phage portal protein [Candidatus Cloacimonetes bacterium]|nr:phage portal protein [Candidatus Cloacimonadota bacterium]
MSIFNIFQRIKLEKEQLKFQRKQIQNANKIYEEYTSDRDPDEDSWTLLQDRKENYTEMQLRDMQKQARKLYYTNSIAKGMLKLITNFVIGKECRVNPDDGDEKVKEYWERFYRMNDFDMKSKEILRRYLRDGEIFVRFFKPDNLSDPYYIRFVDPDEITDPNGQHSYGIETESGDVEKVINYHRSYMKDNGQQVHEIIPADEMLHYKYDVDSNVKRGVSFFVGLARDIVNYRNWLDDRIKLNRLRSMFAVIGEPTGNTTAQSTKDLFEDSSQKTDKYGTYKKKKIKSGSVLLNRGIKWDFKSPNLSASDTRYDGRAILLMIAAGTGGLPEYMVSGDSSNANYSSTLVSEAPGVKVFESLQDILEKIYSAIYRKNIERGLRTNVLPQKTEQSIFVDGNEVMKTLPTKKTCNVQFPILIHRDMLKETKALTLQVESGITSKRTASQELGREFEKEQLQISKEAEGEEL